MADPGTTKAALSGLAGAKDPTTYGMLTYIWVIGLSAWGGAVNFLRKRRAGMVRPFNVTELIGEIATSAFAGLLTFWLCEAAELAPLVTAALVGVSGHMGSRALFHLEHVLADKLGIKHEPPPEGDAS